MTLGFLIKEINELFSGRKEKSEFKGDSDFGIKLNYFFNRANEGVMALSEMIEDSFETFVDYIFYDNKDEKFYTWKLSFDYLYHDIELTVYIDKNESIGTYVLIDRSRNQIEKIKDEFLKI